MRWKKMLAWLILVTPASLLCAWSLAGDKKMEPGPKAPQESLECIKARPGFTVELMAAEPLVQSPIAFAWGADGKFWVVEMGDYPLGTDGKGKPGGRVKCLTKSKAAQDKGGPYDQATVFLDGLSFPTGVTPYGKGVIVTCAPDIFYAEDTTGDGKADKKVVLFTGFAEGNPQHRVNGLAYGFDHWWYGANGDSGGKIKSVKTGKEYDLRGRDFRLRPDDGAFDGQSGQSQFGRARDDWGNWFGNNNSQPMYHYVLDDHYLRRNQYLIPPDPRVQVSVTPGAAQVYPISKALPRFNDFDALNHFTSACSAIVYRDDLFGPEFANNTFVSEPVHNLVHREIMTPKGTTFTSRRADDEQKSEFLASSDNWFRPTTIQTGPDGALWVADMYRYVIEHPQWIPKEWQEKLDLRAGEDKGRIYRVFPKDKKPRPIPVLDKMTARELAELLESPNGWTRDTAQQLLIQRKDPESLKHLGEILQKSSKPLARLHALATAQELSNGDRTYVLQGLKDNHPGVRRWAVRWAEPVLRGDKEVLDKVLALADDPDPQVRLQVAYSLGQIPSAGEALAKTALKHRQDEYLLAAVASSLHEQNLGDFLRAFPLGDTKEFPSFFLLTVCRMAGVLSDPKELLAGLCKLAVDPENRNASYFLVIGAVLDAVDQKKVSIGDQSQLVISLTAVAKKAKKVVEDPDAPVKDKIDALALLGRGLTEDPKEMEAVAGFLNPRTPETLQAAAIGAIVRGKGSGIGELLLESWKGYSPKQRSQILDTLLSREELTSQLLDQIEKKKVLPLEIDAARRQRILDYKSASIKKRAAVLFADTIAPDRAKVLQEYQPVLKMTGDAERGAKIYAKTCATCHDYTGMGPQVGPDLRSVSDKTPEGLLIAILDPNRAVEPRYINYVAVTKTGQQLTGRIASETATSITLLAADGKKYELLRSNIDELTSTSKSVMPEGLEKDLPPQALADVIAYVRGQVTTGK
jgi:putative membrane-bound dehydrogenase-like protein